LSKEAREALGVKPGGTDYIYGLDIADHEYNTNTRMVTSPDSRIRQMKTFVVHSWMAQPDAAILEYDTNHEWRAALFVYS